MDLCSQLHPPAEDPMPWPMDLLAVTATIINVAETRSGITRPIDTVGALLGGWFTANCTPGFNIETAPTLESGRTVIWPTLLELCFHAGMKSLEKRN